VNENDVDVEDPNEAGLFALLLLPKLKVEGEEAEENVPKPLVVLFEVPVFPNEKLEGADPLLFDVLFPKLNEFELPELLLFDVLFPKLKDEGELEGALKLPKVVVLELLLLLLLLLFPNPVDEKLPNEVVLVFPKVEGVEVDD